MSENGEIYTADKNFILLPAVTALTNSTSVRTIMAIAAVEHHVLEMFWERGLSIL